MRDKITWHGLFCSMKSVSVLTLIHIKTYLSLFLEIRIIRTKTLYNIIQVALHFVRDFIQLNDYNAFVRRTIHCPAHIDGFTRTSRVSLWSKQYRHVKVLKEQSSNVYEYPSFVLILAIRIKNVKGWEMHWFGNQIKFNERLQNTIILISDDAWHFSFFRIQVGQHAIANVTMERPVVVEK